jgi:beta-glucosidase-like glycosyl hydrolase
MIFAPFQSTYLSSDTDTYEQLVKLVHETQIGGVLAFGGSEAIPQVMLNNTYGAVVLGQPLELASTLNRLQSISTLPLLASSDFEWGVQMRIAGATKFPRAMAFGATGDPQLAYEAGKVIGAESRALGVHVDFAPVADVNNNPRNPVINIRSFGEDPAKTGAMVASFARGLQDAGMLATLKHFPGHGDTDVDSHLGLRSFRIRVNASTRWSCRRSGPASPPAPQASWSRTFNCRRSTPKTSWPRSARK